jgi:hypothetical protein
MFTKSVDRANPGCILFLVDQSYSMTDPFAGSSRPKVEAVATAINRFLGELITICEKGDPKPRYYFDIGVIGYTTDRDNNPVIASLLQGALAGRELVSIVDLYDNPLDIELRDKDDGAGGLIQIKFPIWYRPPLPEVMLGTPMCAVFGYAWGLLSDWCLGHSGSFPPVVIHLTDGESTDGDPEQAAQGLQSLATSDGNLLVFNCHLSSSTADPILFPDREDQLPDDFARLLFRMSSPLPDRLRSNAEAKGLPAPPGTRGMAFNADGTKMLLLISVGTMIAAPQNLR